MKAIVVVVEAIVVVVDGISTEVVVIVPAVIVVFKSKGEVDISEIDVDGTTEIEISVEVVDSIVDKSVIIALVV